MKSQRRNFTSKFKAKVALEALKGQQTLPELTAKHEVHSTMIGTWKKVLQDKAHELFDVKRGRKSKEAEELTDRLYRQIGQLQMEVEWLKKKLDS